MTERDEPVAQLATRIPKELHRRLKLYCVIRGHLGDGLRCRGAEGEAGNREL